MIGIVYAVLVTTSLWLFGLAGHAAARAAGRSNDVGWYALSGLLLLAAFAVQSPIYIDAYNLLFKP